MVICESFLWPTTPLVGRKIIDFCHRKSQIVLEYASWVCVHSLRPVSLCWASKIGLTRTNECTKQVAKTGKIGTFHRPSVLGLEPKCKIFITRWLRNKLGQSWTTSAAKILMLALYVVVGQWKVTNWEAIRVFSQLVKIGLMENGISWSKKSQKGSKLAQIEAGVKLHSMGTFTIQNLLFLGP